MAKRKKARTIVGSANIVRTAIPKEMNDFIIQFKIELESKSGKKVSKQWAALQLTREFKKNRK